jgi:hypothetical protein
MVCEWRELVGEWRKEDVLSSWRIRLGLSLKWRSRWAEPECWLLPFVVGVRLRIVVGGDVELPAVASSLNIAKSWLP